MAARADRLDRELRAMAAKHEPAPEPAPAAISAKGERAARADTAPPGSIETLSVRLPVELLRELRGAVDAVNAKRSGPAATLTDLIVGALEHERDRLRKAYNRGKPFPPPEPRDRRFKRERVKL